MDVPFYDLYGQTQVDLASDFVHVESVAIRSKTCGWKIKPHRHDKLTQIICVDDKPWHADIDTTAHDLKPGTALLVPAGVVHGFDFLPDSKGTVLSIHNDIFSQIETSENPDIFEFTHFGGLPIHFEESRQFKRFNTILSMLKEECGYPKIGAGKAIASLLSLLFLNLARQAHLIGVNGDASSRKTRIIIAFHKLIEQHYQKHITVESYAEKLHLSVSSLNRICREQLRASPKQLINNRVFIESKRRLIYTRQTLEDIAVTLGFNDVGYFCRQFKRNEGITAGEFRKRNQI